MNLLKLYPKSLREAYIKNIEKTGVKEPDRYYTKIVIISLFLSAVAGSIAYLFKINPLLFFIATFLLLQIIFYLTASLKAGSIIKKIENSFSDAIQLMASNLRAGMTVDKAFLLSARPEFAPLDNEILKTGKEIATGKDINYAFMNLSNRIGSDKIEKTIALIISGMRAGGNISTLLEQTSSNMREREFLEKRAASNVLMYVIFIFFAVAVGAPILFGLSSILIEVIMGIVKNVPATSGAINMPFTFRDIGLSSQFVMYFALAFLLATSFISSLVIGLVNKGDEKSGLRYFIPLAAAAIGIFFAVRFILGGFLADTFSAIP